MKKTILAVTFLIIALPALSRPYLKLEARAIAWSKSTYHEALQRLQLQKIPTQATYQEMMDSAADRYGIPRQLISAVASVESNLNPNDISPMGARGLLQVVPKYWGTFCEVLPEELFIPEINISCGARILALHYRETRSIPETLCLYNSGRKCGENSPRETKEYLVKVLGNLKLL